MKNIRLKVCVWCVLICLLMAFAGCGNNASPANSSAPADKGATPGNDAQDIAPSGTETGSKGKILFTFFTNGPYLERLYVGAERVAKEKGYDIELQTTVGQDPAGLVNILTDAISKDIDILITSTTDSASLTPILKQYMQKGVKVITCDLDVLDPSARDAYAGLMDVPMMGDAMIHDMVAFVGTDDFEYAIIEAPLTSEMSKLRTERMKAVAAEHYPNLKLVAVESGEGDPKIALAAAQNILTKYPDIKGIIANANENAVPICQAIEQAGRIGQCWAFGQGSPAAEQAYFKSGSAAVISLWDPADWGAWTIEVGTALFEGKTFETGKLSDFPDYPDAEKLENNIYYYYKLFTYTKDNVFDFDW